MPRIRNAMLDRRIGRELRAARLAAGRSLTEVAGDLGCSYQQVQKYERGSNALTIAALLAFATSLGFDPVRFLARCLAADAA